MRRSLTNVGQTMRDMAWRPPAEVNFPPKVVDRDVSLPARWAHLTKG